MKRIFLIPFLIGICATVPHAVYASETDGTIVSSGGTVGYAWSDQVGYINLGLANGGIHITDGGITGYAWNSLYGWIHMNPVNGGVFVASDGALSGYGWGSGFGRVNFSGVSINAGGVFTGTATGVVIGTVTFDCANCHVTTDYRPSGFRADTSGMIGVLVGDATSGEGGVGGISVGFPDTGKVTDVLSEAKAGGKVIITSIKQLLTGSTSAIATPADLFDIRFSINGWRLVGSADLIAHVMFEKFSRAPTTVSMFFSVTDMYRNEVWSDTDTIVVETERVFVKRFSDMPELPVGSYTLRLKTVYNGTVRDTFAESFTVLSVADIVHWYILLFGGILSVVWLLVCGFLIRRRKR